MADVSYQSPCISLFDGFLHGSDSHFPRLVLLLRDQPQRRKVLHFNATEHPTGAWIAQQLREAFPEDTAPRYLILDRDRKYHGEATEVLHSLSSELIRTSYQSPWQNGVAERWVGSCRRELLDHVMVFNETHLRRLVREYLDYYNCASLCPPRYVADKSRTLGRVLLMRGLAYVHEFAQPAGLRFRFPVRDD